MKPGKVISFLNMKGGVGKTTLCKELAVYFSEKDDMDVLVIDIDPQSNCTQSLLERFEIFDSEDDDAEKLQTFPSINNLFKEEILEDLKLENVILKLSDHLHLIPGVLDTVFMGRNPNSDQEQKLFNFITNNNLKNEYDYIFIDSPPTYSFYTVSALLISDYYFSPVKPDAYSFLGLGLLEKVVKKIQSMQPIFFQGNPLQHLGVVFTLIDKNPSKGFSRNMDSIRGAYSNMYVFDQHFYNADRTSSGDIGTFFLDRADIGLHECLNNIAKEFEERIEELNG